LVAKENEERKEELYIFTMSLEQNHNVKIATISLKTLQKNLSVWEYQ